MIPDNCLTKLMWDVSKGALIIIPYFSQYFMSIYQYPIIYYTKNYMEFLCTVHLTIDEFLLLFLACKVPSLLVFNTSLGWYLCLITPPPVDDCFVIVL